MVKVLISENSNFSWKIFLKKLAVNSAIVFLTGLIVVWQEDPLYIALVPAIQAMLNYLKNR